MNRDVTIRQLVTRYLGINQAQKFGSYSLPGMEPLAESAKAILQNIPPTFGACAMLSALWAGYLQDHYGIPAIVVAGDLKIGTVRVFKCKENIPEGGKSGKRINRRWDGHCWIEIDGLIGDLSIFRTAYATVGPSVLREFVLHKFGAGRGVLICRHGELEELGMNYLPKYVLKENQINPLIRGAEVILAST